MFYPETNAWQGQTWKWWGLSGAEANGHGIVVHHIHLAMTDQQLNGKNGKYIFNEEGICLG
jgi:hypothetical protein